MKNVLVVAVTLFHLFVPSYVSSAPEYSLMTFSSKDYPMLIQPQLNILFEDFTATWCGWCHFSYEIFDQLFAEYGDRILHIRYHNQDELSMPDIKERRDFYKVNGYPTMVFNGNNKMIGADATTFPTAKKLVEELFLETPQLGLNSFGVMNGSTLQITVLLQSYMEIPISGQFLTVFTESQVLDENSKSYDFVSRAVFPDFKGLTLTIQPDTIYCFRFKQTIPDIGKRTHYQAISFFQDFSTTKVLNSSLYSFNSLPLTKTFPTVFEQDIRRDVTLELDFSEALVVSTIQNSLFLLIDQDETMIETEWEYDTVKKVLRLYPKELLKKKTGYALFILGGKNSLMSSSKHQLRTTLILPFHTSNEPDLNIQLSDWQIDLGEVWPIDNPTFSLWLEEVNQHPVRVKVISKVPWMTVEEPTFIAVKKNIKVSFRPDMMKPGLNVTTLLITTQTGNLYIPVQGTLFKPDYPLIRFSNPPFICPVMKVKVSGKTDGYRMFFNQEEIQVDLDGKFSVVLTIHEGWNVFHFESMNMQRKIGKMSLVMIGFKR